MLVEMETSLWEEMETSLWEEMMETSLWEEMESDDLSLLRDMVPSQGQYDLLEHPFSFSGSIYSNGCSVDITQSLTSVAMLPRQPSLPVLKNSEVPESASSVIKYRSNSEKFRVALLVSKSSLIFIAGVKGTDSFGPQVFNEKDLPKAKICARRKFMEKGGRSVSSAYQRFTDVNERGQISQPVIFPPASANKQDETMRSKREHGRTRKSISLEDVQRHFGEHTRQEAAKSLRVSVPTLKRFCRKHGIERWPPCKRNKGKHNLYKLKDMEKSTEVAEGTLAQTSLAISPLSRVEGANPSLNQFVHTAPPRTTSQDMGTTSQDMGFVTVKAEYEGKLKKFQLSFSARMWELMLEVSKRVNLNVVDFSIEYLDEDDDWVSLDLDDDLWRCIDTARSLERKTIKMKVEPIKSTQSKSSTS